MSIGIELEPNADELTYIHEENVRANLNHYRPWIEHYEHGHELGKLTILLNNHHQIEIKDELYHLISHVCLRSIPTLAIGQKYIYQYMDFLGYIHFHPQHNHITISGDYIATVVAPRNALLSHLYACGMRYVSYLQLLGTNQYQGYLQYLQTYADEAHTALKS